MSPTLMSYPVDRSVLFTFTLTAAQCLLALMAVCLHFPGDARRFALTPILLPR
jgi:hypothetical protein